MLTRRAVVKKLAALATAPFARALRAAAADAPTITLAYPIDVPSWDPIAASSLLTISLYKCVFDKPMNIMPNLSFGPSVVSDYKFLDPNGAVLELEFRPDVTFHNGDKLTSDDFKFTFFDRVKADKTLTLGGAWNLIEAVETPSPTKAVVHFNAPFVTALQLLADSSAYVMPRRYFEKVGRDGFIEKPIGSGPYRVIDYQRDSRIVLEAYDNYWGGAAKIKHVTFQVIKDTSARIAAVQSGQVDFAHNIPVREVARLGAIPGLAGALHSITNVILIHMVNKGIYRDPNLRLAMHHAIDKIALSKAFFGGKGEPLSMWSGSGMPANDPTFKFSYDPGKAKELLAASSFGDGRPAKIEFTTFNGVFPNDFDLARAIVQMWKQVGIEANLSVMELTKFAELARNDRIEAPALSSWFNASGDPHVYSGTLLDPKKRFAIWRSDDIPPRLDPLLVEVDYDKRIAGYRQFDRWVVEQGYAVPLLQGTATVVHASRVNYVPFKNGWILPYYWTASG
jgi:peptide/nickel transport system substrate-binding protein